LDKLNSSSKIINISRLKNKESDRVKSIVELFKSLGGNIELNENEMLIYPHSFLSGVVNSYNDHRIAMVGAIAGICSMGEVQINNAECVNKSFPEFWNMLKRVGVKVE